MVNLHLAKREAVNPPASDMKYVVSLLWLHQMRIRNEITKTTVASIFTVGVLTTYAENEQLLSVNPCLVMVSRSYRIADHLLIEKAFAL